MNAGARARAREIARSHANHARSVAHDIEQLGHGEQDDRVADALRALANAVDELADVSESQEEQ